MSTSGIGDHRERAHGTGRDALAAAGAGVAIDHQILEVEVDRLGGAQRQAQAAAIAHGKVDNGDLGGPRAR